MRSVPAATALRVYRSATQTEVKKSMGNQPILQKRSKSKAVSLRARRLFVRRGATHQAKNWTKQSVRMSGGKLRMLTQMDLSVLKIVVFGRLVEAEL